jgi:hypothetical protein
MYLRQVLNHVTVTLLMTNSHCSRHPGTEKEWCSSCPESGEADFGGAGSSCIQQQQLHTAAAAAGCCAKYGGAAVRGFEQPPKACVCWRW